MFRRFAAHIAVWCLLGCLLGGCGGTRKPAAGPAAEKSRRAKKSRVSKRPRSRAPGPRRSGIPDSANPQIAATAQSGTEEDPAPRTLDRPRGPRGPGTLADLLDRPADSSARMIPNLPPVRVDDARAAAAGIRKLSGRRLTLYTDMPQSKQVDDLPQVFDQAFPQYCKYFNIDPAGHPDWHLTGFLMQQKDRFQRTGLLPDDLPAFQHGYGRNYEFWLYDQPSDYYRRHLALHEGVHCFMNTMLGACGPPWYMEGIAELLSTHRWKEGRLRLNYLPANREEVPQWGRIRIVKDAFAARRAMPLRKVIEYPPHAHLETEPYAWCWAAATLLERHPRYQKRFRDLYKNVLKHDFSERFYRAIGEDWDRLCEEWQVFVSLLEYGHDVSRTVVDFTPGRALAVSPTSVTVAADRGWQNSGLRLDAGANYRLRSWGRYQVAEVPQIWWCEPGGVSIRYYRGRPLGILLAAVRPDQPDKGTLSALLRPVVVGLGTTLAPKQTGTLYLKINDSPAELADNAGELSVEIKRE